MLCIDSSHVRRQPCPATREAEAGLPPQVTSDLRGPLQSERTRQASEPVEGSSKPGLEPATSPEREHHPVEHAGALHLGGKLHPRPAVLGGEGPSDPPRGPGPYVRAPHQAARPLRL